MLFVGQPYHKNNSWSSSSFSNVNNIDSHTNHLNDNLKKISKWAFQKKISFHPGLIKQAQEVIFSRKLKQPTHLPLKFNGSFINQTNYQKHLELVLDSKLNFKEHLKNINKKLAKQLQLFADIYLNFHYLLY